jgi:hypothetical protein
VSPTINFLLDEISPVGFGRKLPFFWRFRRYVLLALSKVLLKTFALQSCFILAMA